MHQQPSAKNQMLYDGPFRVRSYDHAKSAYIIEHLDGRDTLGGPVIRKFLKPFRGSLEDAENEESDELQRYEVRTIEDSRTVEGKREYKVKWLGHTDRTWEPEENLEGAERAGDAEIKFKLTRLR